MVRLENLTIYLLKPGINRYADALRPNKKDDPRPPLGEARLRGNVQGKAYFHHSERGEPDWAPFLREGVVAEDMPNLASRHWSGLVLIKARSRMFALAFGYGGRYLIDPNDIEPDFGLRVALNALDTTQIRSIDTKIIDTVTRHKRTQTNRDTTVGAFTLDPDQDILRAITGVPADEALAKQLTGKHPLHMRASLEFKDLPDKLSALLDLYEGDEYKENWGWVDNQKAVEDPAIIEELDAALVRKLKAEGAASVGISPPEIVDWAEITGLRLWYEPEGTKYPDLQGYLDVAGAHLSAENMRTRMVIISTGLYQEKANIYRCLEADLEYDGDTYVLHGGGWYRVATEFMERVANTLDAIPDYGGALPERDAAWNEAAYNEHVAGTSPETYALLDCDPVVIPGVGKAEACDLFTTDKQLVHVKIYDGGSGPMSHLFAQGSVSGLAFRDMEEFRTNIRDKLPSDWKALVPNEAPEPQSFEVVYAIITHRPEPIREVLPFFSKLNLITHNTRLRALGFKVSLAKIPSIDHAPPVPKPKKAKKTAKQPKK